VVDTGRRLDRRLLVVTILLLNAAWLVTLAAIGEQFQRAAGVPLLDLQNSVLPGEVMTPSRALEQIAAYPPEAIGLYWSFFVLDNLMPPLVFGAFALLWANLLHEPPGSPAAPAAGHPGRAGALRGRRVRLGREPRYVSAIATADPATATVAIWVGLVAKWVKAAFVQVTSLTTAVVVVVAVLAAVRRRRTPASRGPLGRSARRRAHP
jgi:hypothetical protein